VTDQLGACGRCGLTVRVDPDRNPEARLLRRSLVPEGLCVDCAATEFLLSTLTLAQQLERLGPNVLLLPEFQALFARLMQSGQADAKPGEINWRRVKDNWHLPFPKTSTRRAACGESRPLRGDQLGLFDRPTRPKRRP
jgi:hypothetical protein